MRGKIKEFPSYFVFVPLLETYLNKANDIIYEKLSRVFSVSGFRFKEK